jgi:UMF1 family MFS transporter
LSDRVAVPTDAPRPARGWLHALGLSRPELRAWAMYDWANSAMVTTIIAAVFPIYFGKVACRGFHGSSTALLASVTTLAMIVSAVLSPLLGALADTRPWKKALLGAFLALGLASVAGMFFIGPGDWLPASVLFVLANVGANGSFVFYDSLLPHIARDGEMDRVSSAGYALGYLGGGTLLALNLAWIQKPAWFGLPSPPALSPLEASALSAVSGGSTGVGLSLFRELPAATLPARLAFLSVAVWWAVFSIPLFLRVPEPPVSVGPARGLGGGGLVAQALSQLSGTFSQLKRFRAGLVMLAAFLIYNDGIGTIIRMATKYGEEIGIGEGTMIASLVLTQFVGIPFAFLFGFLSGRIPTKVLILFCLAAYVAISVLGFFMKSDLHFMSLALLVAMVQGGSQALSRSLFASLIPKQKSGEFFGFFAVVEKFAGIFGPLLFALSIVATGSTRASILTIIPFFVVGAALLLLVDVAGGRAAARAAEAAIESEGTDFVSP